MNKALGPMVSIVNGDDDGFEEDDDCGDNDNEQGTRSPYVVSKW